MKYISIDFFEINFDSTQFDKQICTTERHEIINNYSHLFVKDVQYGLVSDYDLDEHFICIENMDKKEIFKLCLKYGVTVKI